ncbi:alpha/beta hydrolase [Saccharicrinis fermentans]|uniref:Endo-1,4-beta-xylanase Z n=1 Tax=Saccharicrinis fermentans DSM 9555 = JCM 21142 TaxID=869213 RepID=W7XV47_9BACT|nr:alpha/beta hydrolase-fold protein [Saccharicrinis fermentans]GAF01945.1 endo-1,4-beta-xylanase Z precursor [Saccharicrinis fermentans DSM 9555 = JCM 21142]
MRRIIILSWILFVFVCSKAANIDTLMVYSKSMGKTLPNLVITPDGYSSKQKAYPVVYLLHGAGGDFMAWLKKVPDLPKYADQYDFILICPEGGKTSWYFNSPVDKEMQFETYITQEVVPEVDNNYHTVKNKEGRAITGFSMGGHGAFIFLLETWTYGGRQEVPVEDWISYPFRIIGIFQNV